MNGFKKILLALLVAVLATGAVFAGGNSEEPAPANDPAPANEPAPEAPAGPQSQFEGIDLNGVEVVFWHQHTRSREEGLKGLVEDFNATNPYGITVMAEYAGGYGDIYNKMQTGLASGQVPDLVVGYQNQAGAYQLADGLVDIDQYVYDPMYGLTPEEIEDFLPGIFMQDKNAQFDGMRLGFPPNRSMQVLYYNMDMLAELGYDAAPQNWEEFAEMARAATNPEEGTYGYAINTDASAFFGMVASLGGDIAEGPDYVLNTPEAKAAMNLLVTLYNEGAAQKIAERYGDQTDFGNGKVLFTIGSTSGLPYYKSAVEGGEKGEFDWSVAPLPHSTAKPQQDLYGASVSIPKTTEEKQLAAWLFVKWLTETPQQVRWVEISNYFPTRRSALAGMEALFADNPQYTKAIEIFKTSDLVTEPPFASYETVRREIDTTVNAILDGEDVDNALALLEEEANAINEEYQVY